MRTKKAMVVLVIFMVWSCFGQGRTKPHFGLYYAQSSSTLFSVGIVEQKEFNRIPFMNQLQAGYVYDNRSNKEYGHGLAIDLVLVPFFTVNKVKFGPFGGIDLLMEAYQMTEIDFMYRERDVGWSAGGYCQAWDHVSVRMGIIKYYEVSKFFMLWEGYRPCFMFALAGFI